MGRLSAIEQATVAAITVRGCVGVLGGMALHGNPSAITPGSTWTFRFNLTVPAPAGIHPLQCRMSHMGVHRGQIWDLMQVQVV
jgi:hypothetical protein